jgi:hypothetical protein
MAHESFPLPIFGSPGWTTLMGWRRKKLREMMPNGKVSPNFSYGEFFTHDGTPIPVLAVPALRRLCSYYLEPMRKKFGTAFVLSGYRHRTYNAKIGGALHSQHIWDEGHGDVAADIRFAKGTPKEWAAEARRIRNGIGHGGVGRYKTSRFVHIDNRQNQRADWNPEG